MSQDQRPGKVKLYSGQGGRPGAGTAVQRLPGAAQPAAAGALPSGAAAVAALPAPDAKPGSALPWIPALLFVLGCIAGAAAFVMFAPF